MKYQFLRYLTTWGFVGGLMVLLAACGGDGVFSRDINPETRSTLEDSGTIEPSDRETIFDLFNSGADPNVTVAVNRYLWNASLEILDFMPVESADPFSGVISFGYGTPPGGSRAYRATVLVRDPALEARSLRVSVQSRGGAVSRDVVRRIEDAILTRARQLRVQDAGL